MFLHHSSITLAEMYLAHIHRAQSRREIPAADCSFKLFIATVAPSTFDE